MLVTGCALLLCNIIFRAALLPAEQCLAGDPSNYPRIFFSGVSRVVYRTLEFGSRWVGSILIAGSWVGFERSLSTLILGGVVAGVLASALAPILTIMIATRVHRGFKPF